MKAIFKFYAMMALWLILAYPAISQTTNDDTLYNDTTTTTTTPADYDRTHDDDDDTNWGWIGLVGLLGLLGLRGNRDRDVTVHRRVD